MTRHRIILASGSPRRKELLAKAGYNFEIITSSADESFDAALKPEQVAPLLAQRKAEAVAATLEDAASAIVIGADTIVAYEGTIYGKPVDAADARRMLFELSGKTHQVITGFCLITKGACEVHRTSTSVTFKQLSTEEIETYVKTGEPMDKAGAYGIQGLGGALVQGIDGSFDNVVGLPTEDLIPVLEKMLKS